MNSFFFFSFLLQGKNFNFGNKNFEVIKYHQTSLIHIHETVL